MRRAEGDAEPGHGTPDVERALAEFASELTWDQVPPGVQRRVVDMLIDALANGIAGSVADRADRVAGVFCAVEGPGSSGVLGTARRLSLLGAAGQNAFQITAFTMCDVYRPALCHVTPEVVPAVLAVAGSARSGADLLTGLAVGLESTTRIGRGLGYREFRGRGFHTPGVIGPIGAAAAASRVLGVGPEEVHRAMGLAGAHAAGTFAGLGSDAIKVHQVHGARAAVLGTHLAAAGLRGADRILTAADGGILAACSDGGTPERIVAELGTDWELTAISLRARPGSSSVQAVGECALELVDRLGPVHEPQLRSAQVRVPPSAYAMCASATWTDQLGALQSAPFLVAALLAGGEWWIELFGEGPRDEPAVRGVAARVEVVADDSVPLGGAVVQVALAEGTTAAAVRPCALGDPANPMERSHVEQKLRSACASASAPCDADSVLGAVDGLASAPDADALLRSLGMEPS